MSGAPSPIQAHSASPQELRERIEAERRGRPFLVFRDDEREQPILELDGRGERLSVGRGLSNQLSLPWDTEVSRLHAELECIAGEWTVSDDGLSRNGTYVNGERITARRRLRDGDRVVFGETPIVYRMPATSTSFQSTAAVRVADAGGPLTPVQRRVLVALCRPLKLSAYAAPATNREIAEEVFLSVDAVKAHLRVLFERFGLEGLPQNQKRARLAAAALVNGVVAERDF
jgi:pSer/pThr/pTyr-binding forkhead associated (FHA) protein